MKALNLFLLLPALMATAFIQAQTSSIIGIEAKMFYNEDKSSETKNTAGTFSENIIENPGVTLWNVIIGEGSSAGYTDQTIVLVNVRNTGLSNTEQTLRLTVTMGTKVLSTTNRNFSCIDDPADYKVLFLLNDVGCDVLDLKAELIRGGKIVSVMSKKIEFYCGE
jgi:hypothetical protein